MCRMCSYYTKIDLAQIPTSNPFLDGITSPSPVEPEAVMPNNIVIESPDSTRHTAWTNMRRFPSLYRPVGKTQRHSMHMPAPSSSQPTPRSISIYGPQERSKSDRHSFTSINTQGQQRHSVTVQLSDSAASFHHKLQHYNRVDSFPEAMTDGSVSSISSPGSTPRSLSPVSDDEEFDYLPSLVRVFETRSPHTVRVKKPVKFAADTSVHVPEPLRFTRYNDQPTTQWR